MIIPVEFGVTNAWWDLRRPWPSDLKYEDVDAATLAFERLIDPLPLGPPPAPPGAIGCTGALCADHPMAEAR